MILGKLKKMVGIASQCNLNSSSYLISARGNLFENSLVKKYLLEPILVKILFIEMPNSLSKIHAQ